MRRQIRPRTIALMVLSMLGCALFWHVGQPFWGNWPQVDAKVTSHYEYAAKGGHCSFGLDYEANGKPVHGHFTILDLCNAAPSIGTMAQLGVDPGEAGWVIVPEYSGMPMRQLIVTGTAIAVPVLGWAFLTGLTIGSLLAVSRLGARPWHEVAGVVVSSSWATRGLRSPCPDACNCGR